MSEAALRAQLYDSYKNRAMIYYLIYDELRTELGEDRAEDLLGRALYRRGESLGQEKYGRFAPKDLAGLQKDLLDTIPDNGRMFHPKVVRSDAEEVDIQFQGCPLRDAWVEAGLPDEEIVVLCRIASQIDEGMFTGAGFNFTSDTWQPGEEGCCRLHIRPGE